jgi:hypothetical protein
MGDRHQPGTLIGIVRNPQYGYPDEFRITEVTFKEGNLYKIADVTSIAELAYEGQAVCKFKRPPHEKVFL